MTTTSPHSGLVRPSAPRLPSGVSRWQKVVGVLGLVVMLWVGDRLYDVVSRGTGDGPGRGHGPADRIPTSQPTDTRDPAPGGGGGSSGHDPSRFDHG